jgi:hypothetical protein
MRGAVLSALGLRVQEHVMRRHYGVVLQAPFEPNDPKEFFSIGADGRHKCLRKFYWYTKMVRIIPRCLSCFQDERVPYGHAIEHSVQSLYGQLKWDKAISQLQPIELWISETVAAPKYNYSNVSGKRPEK